MPCRTVRDDYASILDGYAIGLGYVETNPTFTATGAARSSASTRSPKRNPSAAFYLRMGARRTGTIPAKPPKVGWDRPELRFDVPTC
ncbi:hypothetical protein [Amycolatopsis rifamycinica]|uniref:hypothetical protein n=1 Tax=Amycolatopsis rifamycinica TaxID=287986 RepID=UPI000A5B3CE8|nr:hypothetical protein [Amycolatopsis rifamycinica]